MHTRWSEPDTTFDQVEIFLFFLIVWVAIGGGIGYAIGNTKGRGNEGFWLGALLGWIGWIIVALLQPTVQAQVERDRQVAAATAAQAGVSQSRWDLDSQQTVRGGGPKTRAEFDAARSSTSSMLAAADDGSEGRDRRIAAVARFVEDVGPQKPVVEWMFADGSFCAVARHNGNLYLISQSTVRRVGFRDDPSFEETADGRLLTATIDGVQLSNPRPEAKARELLDGLRARRSERDAPPEPQPASEPAATTVAAAPHQRTPRERLAALDELRRDGTITDDEYAQRRQRILDEI